MHVGLLDLDEAQPGGRIEFDGAGICLLADDLLVDLGLRGNVNDEIAQDLRLAGEAAALRQPADPVVALLDLGDAGDMRSG